MWTETAREQYRREDLRYASDMTDAEWALISPHLPGQKALGRPRIVALREQAWRSASPPRAMSHAGAESRISIGMPIFSLRKQASRVRIASLQIYSRSRI